MKPKRLLSIVAIIALLCMVAIPVIKPAEAVPMPMTVYGIVEDEDGDEVSNAKIVATNLDEDGDHNYLEVYSDNDGGYVIELGNMDYDNDAEIDGVSEDDEIQFVVTKTIDGVVNKDIYTWTVTSESYKVIDFTLSPTTTTGDEDEEDEDTEDVEEEEDVVTRAIGSGYFWLVVVVAAIAVVLMVIMSSNRGPTGRSKKRRNRRKKTR